MIKKLTKCSYKPKNHITIYLRKIMHSDMKAIVACRGSGNEGEDHWIWLVDTSNSYTVNLAYKDLYGSSFDSSNDVPLHCQHLHPPTPSKNPPLPYFPIQTTPFSKKNSHTHFPSLLQRKSHTH